ncbi:hypothetical protein GLOIN_2v1769896 [Rhizophagus irregularis DAOM 181602=DAOM 197198]|nr:hypothetical protein GLOIN_2v1769896 [Rhizophagus irregularis DAOM 181602=DAOM 197198]
MSFNKKHENPHNETNVDNDQDRHDNRFKNIIKDMIKKIRITNLFNNKENSSYKSDNTNDDTIKKEDYRIAIFQDGKFAVTFDTANLRIKILENTDHRTFNMKESDNKKSEKSDVIDKTIAYFRINDNFTISKFYDKKYKPPPFNQESKLNTSDDDAKEDEKSDTFRWSFDVSNLHKNDDEYYILVAVSRVNVNEDMKENKRDNTKFDFLEKIEFTQELAEFKEKSGEPPDPPNTPNKEKDDQRITIPDNTPKKAKKGIAIYRLKLKEEKKNFILNDVTCYYSDSISGICSFIEVTNDDDVEQRRFIIFNFRGIYNFEFNSHFDYFNLNEKFKYPQSIRRELDNWYTDSGTDCMKRLLTCIYDKYFLVTQYKNDVQSLEVYNLAKMELETTAKRVEDKEKYVKQYNYDTFSVSKLQLCFTRGINIIKLYYMENGECPKEGIMLIIWDLYNTGKYHILTKLGDFPITIKENIGTHLARTSGNILQVNDNGNIKSIVKFIENLKQKKIEENLKQKKSEENLRQNLKIEDKKPDGKPDRKHNIYCDVNINFKPIVSDKEPWVLGDYERTSYCLYYNKKRTLTETLQLIVGRSTVQIWHQINDENKLKRKKEHLPNKGEPFLEYIWTNRIPVNQESEETRLQISKFECEPNDSLHDKLRDFYLKVYWYEVIEDNVENLKETEHETSKEDNEEIEIRRKRRKSSVKVEWLEQNISMEEGGKIDKMIKHEKVIKRKDIIEKFHAIRHACKALEHLNKRYKSKFLANNYIRVHEYEEMISYIKHIVWRYAKNDPENFKLLDVRHNVMKNLILGDCDHLIKFILFKDEEENTENKNVYKEIEVKEKREKVKRQEFEIRHIPRDNLWPEESFLKDDDLDFYERKDNRLEDNEKIKPRNNMELAIYHCKGRELKDTIIVAYFLEYYSRNATDCAGWMSSVSKALPLLFKYNYDDYARKLFFKECFADQDHFSAHDPDDIIPIECRERRNHDIKFRAFKPLVRLESNKYKWYNKFWNLFKKSEENLSLKHKIYKSLENFDNDLGKSPLALRIVPLPIIFYYLAFYQLVTEALQFHYRGFKKYFDEIFNSFDIISIVLSVTVMSIMFKNFQFSDGFGSVKVIDTGLIAGISFSIFFLWIELILYLRIISDSIKIKESTYSGIATNDLKNETLDIKLKSDFDPKSSDNPYSLFSDAIIATYFWIGGNWAQRDEFDFWAIDVFSLIASIFLVIVLQNMLIAFMNGIYTTAETKEEWYATRKDEQGAIYKDFEEKSTFTKRTYKERDYDKYSILVYEEDIKVEIEKIKNMKNDVNVTIEYLIKKLYDIKSKVDDNKTDDDDDDDDDGNIEIMEDIEKNINDVVERLLKKLDKSN